MMSEFLIILGIFAFIAVLRDALTADRETPPDADHAARVLQLRVKQGQLAARMKRDGRSLLAGKPYKPALTKPADSPPRFADRVVVPFSRSRR